MLAVPNYREIKNKYFRKIQKATNIVLLKCENGKGRF